MVVFSCISLLFGIRVLVDITEAMGQQDLVSPPPACLAAVDSCCAGKLVSQMPSVVLVRCRMQDAVRSSTNVLYVRQKIVQY